MAEPLCYLMRLGVLATLLVPASFVSAQTNAASPIENSAAAGSDAADGTLVLHEFARQMLSDVYFSEGAGAGDLNGDQHVDVVCGPYWWEGPEFETRHELYRPVPQNREGYADNFFSWVYDFDGDGWRDVLVVGFPGTPAYVYQNPGPQQHDRHWPKHQILDWVSNESPQFVQLVGDDTPELVCTRDGFFGYAIVNRRAPWEAWEFVPVSEQIAPSRFGHGLGVGDVNGDGREDILFSGGWFEQPTDADAKGRWRLHPERFTRSYGGAEMYAYDVDGDGDQDVITSDAAHDFGLGWYEQRPAVEATRFVYHPIMGSHPAENEFGLVFSELHSVALADMDGDGLKDIVTGKTYYSHHRQSPMWDAGAVVYWFRLVREPDGVHWIPYRADNTAGIGRQLNVVDITGDGLPDMVMGGMKGTHVLRHQTRSASPAEWQKAQPQPYAGPELPDVSNAKPMRGPKLTSLGSDGRVSGVLEAESWDAEQLETSAGTAAEQAMGNFAGDRWSGDAQLFWRGGRRGDTLRCTLPAKPTARQLEIAFTCAPDYAIVQLFLGEEALGDPIDLYDPQVINSGAIRLPLPEREGDEPLQLTVQIAGANAKARPTYFVGIDYVRLIDEEEGE